MNLPTSPSMAQKATRDEPERVDSLAMTVQMRETLIESLMHDQLQTVRSQQDVAALLSDADKRLTANVVALREEMARLQALVLRSEDAFKGELAMRAAQLARREFMDATAGVMGDFSAIRREIERHAGAGRLRRLADAAVVAIMASGVTGVITLAGVWAVVHR